MTATRSKPTKAELLIADVYDAAAELIERNGYAHWGDAFQSKYSLPHAVVTAAENTPGMGRRRTGIALFMLAPLAELGYRDVSQWITSVDRHNAGRTAIRALRRAAGKMRTP